MIREMEEMKSCLHDSDVRNGSVVAEDNTTSQKSLEENLLCSIPESLLLAIELTARKKSLQDCLQKLIDITKSQVEKYNNPKIVKVFVCCGCKQRFKYYHNLLNHVTRPSGQLIFRCQICLITIESFNICQIVNHAVKQHLNEEKEHPAKIPIELIAVCAIGETLKLKEVCPECRKGFGSIIAHLWSTNPGDRARQCPYCYTFVTKNICRYNLHVKVHKCTAPFRCPDCAKLFINSTDMHAHLNNVCRHLEQSTRYKCSVCELVFRTNVSLQKHLFSDHNPTKYKCHLCPAEMNIASEKNSHYEKKHYKEMTIPNLRRSRGYIKTHKCLICNEEDLKGVAYERHVRKHMEEPEIKITLFMCSCSFVTMYKGTYLLHRSVSCKQLEFTPLSSSIAVLKVCIYCSDIKFYNGSDPFICEVCEYPNVTEESPFYKCLLCCKLLPYCIKDVILHLRLTHGRNLEEEPYYYAEKGIKSMNEEANQKCIPEIEIAKVVTTSDCPLMEETNETLRRNEFQFKDSKKEPSTKAEFKDVNNLLNEGMHEIQSDLQFKCSKCDSCFAEKDQLRFHYVSAHRTNPGDYQCLECGEAFRSIKSLSIHLQFHGITDANCYINKYDVSNELRPQNFTVNNDNDSLELVCSVCEKTFSDNSELNQHLRSHGMAFLKRMKYR